MTVVIHDTFPNGCVSIGNITTSEKIACQTAIGVRF